MKLQLKEQVKDLNKGIQGFTQAAMLLKHINADTLRDDLTQAVCDRAFIGEDELPRNACYGDGSPIEADALASIREAFGSQLRRFDWKRDDVLLLDNMRYAHGRDPFSGPRRVHVGMASACSGASA